MKSRSTISVHPGDDGFACVIRTISFDGGIPDKVQVLTEKGSWKTLQPEPDALIPRKCFHMFIEGQMGAVTPEGGELNPIQTMVLQIKQKVEALEEFLAPE